MGRIVLALCCLAISSVSVCAGDRVATDADSVSAPSRASEASEAILRGYDQAVELVLDKEFVEQARNPVLTPKQRSAVEEIRQSTAGGASAKAPQAVSALGGDESLQAQSEAGFGQGRTVDAQEPSEPSGRRYVVFASQSMPSRELETLATSLEPDASLAFRGLLDGQQLPDFARLVRGWSNDPSTLGSVVIDPRPFQELRIEKVPAIAVRDGAQWIAVIYGVTGRSELDARVESGARGDLGSIGPTVGISEPDLLDRFRTEMPAHLTRRARASTEAFWMSAPLPEFPPAPQLIERVVDPSITVRKDIVLPNGQRLYAAGDRINPFSERGFQSRLIVIDARHEWQLDLARLLISEGLGRQRVMVLLSGLDRDAGWDGFHAVGNDLGVPVYVLNSEISERFALAHSPALIEGRGTQIFIREYPMPVGPKIMKEQGNVDPGSMAR